LFGVPNHLTRDDHARDWQTPSVDDLDDLGAPNCPTCLLPLKVEGELDTLRWVCPSCGVVRLA